MAMAGTRSVVYNTKTIRMLVQGTQVQMMLKGRLLTWPHVVRVVAPAVRMDTR